MLALILILTTFLFIGGIFFVPVRIVLNIRQKEYYISLPGYLRADLIFENIQSLRLKLRILMFTFKIEPGVIKPKSVKIREEWKEGIQKPQ